MRTTMIELLIWTYRDELPKRDRLGYGDAWGPVEARGKSGGYDVEPMPRLPAVVGAPHPDAELVDRRVKAMERFLFIPPGAEAAGEARRLAARQPVSPAPSSAASSATR
jgi:hypothetical protein